MGAISIKHTQLGGAGGPLGAPVGAETVCPDGQGRFRHYAGGSIYWHASTGAHEVHGAIRDRWASLGWELSWLGYPTSDEITVSGGKRSSFQHGRVDWSGATGAVDSDGVDFATYTSKSGDGHQAEFNRLRPLGYRIVSLNMYGFGNPSYAATWVKRSGPTWAATHGRTAAQLTQWGAEQAAAGLHPTIVAACGTGAGTLFSMVTERVTGALPIMRLGMRFGDVEDAGTLQHWNRWARANGYVLASLATYGDLGTLQAVAVWQPNTTATGWSIGSSPVLVSVDAELFGVQTAHGARPFVIERSEAPLYVSVYRDDSAGPWLARGNLSRAQYQSECAGNRARGYFPRVVAGSGSGAAERFNVLFSKREHALPHRFVATGARVAAMAAIDDAVADYMRRNDIRGGTLAVARDGQLKLARGYTWGPSTYPITQPATLFRIGSISKTLTNILIHQLIERRLSFTPPQRLTLGTRIMSVLGLTPPPGMAAGNPHFADITVFHCLAHRSGVSPNFAHLDLDVVQAFGSALPARNKREIAAMLMTLPAQFEPNEQTSYANSGYLLLAAVIEHVTGRPWFDVLRTNVLNPLGLMRPRPSGSLLSQRVDGEALYHDPNLVLVRSVMTPAQPLVRVAYGDPNLTVGDGVGGMAFSAAELVKLYAALLPSVTTPVLSRTTIDDVMWSTASPKGWMTGMRAGGVRWFGHNGGLANMQSFAAARSDGIVYALAFNKEWNDAEPAPLWDDLLDDVSPFPAHDLFPSLGIPSFA
ncbi:MAG: serine hydrolase [Gemmatimonadaceae bacterium]